MLVGRDNEVAALAAALDRPGLVVVAGPAGIGKTAVVSAAHAVSRRPVLATGALATLRHRPGLPLTRALRAPVPVDDAPLAAEAVRARLGDRVLLVDDVHWADDHTLAVLAAVAEWACVVVTLRTPSPVAERLAATTWLDLPGLPAEAARALVPGASDELLERTGGNPLALVTLARHPELTGSALAHATAAVVGELPVAARTALAALGLLGRPAPAALLGPGAAELVAAGLVTGPDDELRVREPYVAEVAAGVLPAKVRAGMHARLGALLTDDVEAARHLAAAGDPAGAVARARRAAGDAPTAGGRADALLVAAAADPGLAVEAATACAAAGRPGEVLRLLEPTDPDRRVLVAGALLDTGRPDEAEAALGPEQPTVGYAVVAARVELPREPARARARAAAAVAQHGPVPELLAVRAAALRATGSPDWAAAAREALTAARHAGDAAAEWLAGAALVAGLRDDCRVADARDAAVELADRAAAVGAYSAEVGFRAEALWAAMHLATGLDEVLAAAATLADRTAPAEARALLLATLALAHADAGGLPTARSLLGRAGSAAGDRTVRWVGAETAWLDGDPAGAGTAAAELTGTDLPAALAAVTALWSGRTVTGNGFPAPVAGTLAAGTPDAFAAAADGWVGVMVRERVRCLLAAGEAEPLLAAERLAADAGLATLLGRVRRALRGHGVTRRPTTGGGTLSPREREALALVGQGLSTRRIAELLGITRHTAETYVKAGMGKLGARTRTEAAVLAAGLPVAAGA